MKTKAQLDTFGRRLRSYRQAAGLSANALASLTNSISSLADSFREADEQLRGKLGLPERDGETPALEHNEDHKKPTTK